MELFKLFGTIAVNNKDANEAIDETTEKTEGFGKSLAKGIRTVGKWALAIGTAAVSAGGALFGFAQKAAGATDAIDKMSQKIGVSRETYQELDFILSQSGTSVDGLQTGMKSLTAAMDGAASGTESNVEQFKKLGVSVTNADGSLRSQEEVMWDVFEALQNMDNQTEKARLATELFGRSGTELMPLLNGASGSIEEMRKKAHDLGLVLDDETIDSGVEFSDTLDQVKRALGSAATQIGVSVMPIVMQLLNFILDHMPEIRAIMERVFTTIGNVIGTTVRFVGDLVQKFRDFKTWCDNNQQTVQLITTALIALGGAIAAVTLYTQAQVLWTKLAAAAQKAYNLIMNANPIMLVIAAIGALVAAFIYLWNTNEDFRQFWINLWEKLKNVIKIAKEKISGWINNLKQKFEEFRKKAEEIKNKIVQTWENLKQKTLDLKNKIVQFFENIKQGITDKITAARNKVREIFENIKKLITDKITAAKNKVQSTFENVKTTITNKITAAKNKVREIFENIRSTIHNKITNAKQSVVDVFNAIRDKIRNTIESAKQKVSTAVSRIKSLLGFAGLKQKVTDLFEGIKEKITSPIDKAKGLVDTAVSTIKNLFPISMGKIFSGVQLPHFKISGGKIPWGIGGAGEKPTVGIDWYAKAMNNPLLLNKATIFGVNDNGQFMGGGESGQEIVSGTRTLMNMISAAMLANRNDRTPELIEQLISMLSAYMPQIIANGNKQIVMDNGALVGAMLPAIDSRLGELQRLRERGR